MKKIMFAFVCSVLSFGCEIIEKKTIDIDTEIPIQLIVYPEIDTLYLNATSKESRTMGLVGVYVDRTEQLVTNKGALTSADFTIVKLDYRTKWIDARDAQWSFSNSRIAHMNQQKLQADAGGVTSVWATYNGVTSDSIVVYARVDEAAHGLTLNPPYYTIIFRDSIEVSGTVQTGARLRIEESRSGFRDTVVSYDVDGKYLQMVTGLQTGRSVISVTAVHPTRNYLSTTRSKTVLYYEFGSLGADSIVGNWQGECEGKPIRFTISKSPIITRYDISGTIDIKVLGYGIVQDVQLMGFVGSDGNLNLSVTKSFSGFTLSGSMVGRFSTIGKAEGSIYASLKKSGWPNMGFKANWWAEKK